MKGCSAAKGALYLGLKRPNDAGRALHADELAPAARFNLKILYRKAGKRGAGDAEDPTAGPTPGAYGRLPARGAGRQ